MKKISIIIPSQNSLLIAKIYNVLEKQITDPKRTEILIIGVDDFDLLRPNTLVHFIKTEKQTNAAVNRNIGIQLAKGEILFFLDSDCLPAPNWLRFHIARHKNGSDVVGGAITFGRQNYFQLADNVSAFHDLLPHMPKGNRPYLAAANLSIKREVIDKVGLMEPTLDRAQDLDWTVRMRKQNFELYFEPRAVVFHDPPRNEFRKVWRHWTDNAPYTLQVRRRYGRELATPKLASYRWPFLWLSPLIAAWATARTFSNTHTLFTYWATFPLVFITKLAWCWSAFWNYHPNTK